MVSLSCCVSFVKWIFPYQFLQVTLLVAKFFVIYNPYIFLTCKITPQALVGFDGKMRIGMLYQVPLSAESLPTSRLRAMPHTNPMNLIDMSFELRRHLRRTKKIFVRLLQIMTKS